MSDNATIDRLDAEAVNTEAKAKGILYAKRKKLFPKDVSGTFRRLKWVIMAITLTIYYVSPLLRWDRGPFAPDQAILLDMANRRFYFFFIEIWPQEFFFVAGLLVMAGVGLFLVTSVVGRAWCGYACPQTVWTDLFMAIERFFEGDRNARMRLDAAPWTADKFTRRVLKHATWIIVAMATGGAWIFYFADAPTLARDFLTGQAPFIAYATVAVFTFTTYVLGGLMREQVCIYMCPWPRIQAAMLDEDSLVVTYNDWRGEPRSRGAKKAAAQGLVSGDCVDCNACVAVCPTGIDIRNGQQMECITCALCIDACNGIMEKLGRERDLISYSTLRDYNHNKAIALDPETGKFDPARVRGNAGKLHQHLRNFDWRIFLRPRTLVYMGAWALVGLGLLTALLLRDRLELNVLHDRNPTFVKLSNGDIRNGYTVKLLNMVQEPRTITLSINDLPGASMNVEGVENGNGRSVNVPVEPDKLRAVRVFITQSSQLSRPGQASFTLTATDPQSFETDTYSAEFTSP